MEAVTLHRVNTPGEFREFERVSERLHGRDPRFVPPFPGSIRKLVGPKAVFRKKHGDLETWVARRGGRPVGRIAAIHNRTYDERYGKGVGFFGFFDCENVQGTTDLLFYTASDWLRERGCTVIRGPYSPTINDECGLLVTGFDDPSTIGLPWNPTWTVDLVRSAGFSTVRRLIGFRLPFADQEPNARMAKIAKRLETRARLKLRPIRLDRLEEELAVIQHVYNDTLERNWGFIPIDLEELQDAASDFKMIADPEMILIAEADGEPVGVALSLPNPNEWMTGLHRFPEFLRPLLFLFRMRTMKREGLRFLVYGILPKFRDRGLHPWLIHEQFVRGRTRFSEARLGWVEENNHEIIQASLMQGAYEAYAWEIFERAIEADR